jgi:nitric oxide reductase activation protein
MGDSAYDDCRKAVTEFRKRYIETYCVSIDFGCPGYLKEIYESNKYFPLNSIEDIRPMLIRMVANMTRI